MHPQNIKWLDGVVGYHICLTVHSPELAAQKVLSSNLSSITVLYPTGAVAAGGWTFVRKLLLVVGSAADPLY